MINYRCKCGDKTAFGSMPFADCQGCEICNTTFASYPDGHKELQPHDWFITYNQNTGKPYKRCKNCHTADLESYQESQIK
jgi:hypothetical protein